MPTPPYAGYLSTVNNHWSRIGHGTANATARIRTGVALRRLQDWLLADDNGSCSCVEFLTLGHAFFRKDYPNDGKTDEGRANQLR
jgi:hypothetical protein